MIPKIIHYCWLGQNELPDDIKNCIESWKIKLPDYELMLWDTNRFDVNVCPYTQEAFAAGKYAFVSDYIRLYALYHHGGIYLDSDIEMLKSLDDLLDQEAFTGFESSERIAAWIFGSEKGNPIFKEFLQDYEGRHFLREDGSYDLTPNPIPITQRLLEHGLDMTKSDQIQHLDCMTIYPMDYFCPFNPYRESGDCFTENTYMNHYFSGSWKSRMEHRVDELEYALRKKVGFKAAKLLMKPCKAVKRIKDDGFAAFVKYVRQKFQK